MTAAKTILAVDDEPDMLEAIQEYLQATLPVRVVTAPSGPAALELLRRQEVSLIISDSRMPGMDGVEFLGRARAQHPDVPRVLLTAHADLELAVRALNEASIDQLMLKPVDPQRLQQVVRECLGLK